MAERLKLILSAAKFEGKSCMKLSEWAHFVDVVILQRDIERHYDTYLYCNQKD